MLGWGVGEGMEFFSLNSSSSAALCSVTSHGHISITTNMSGGIRKKCGEKRKE